MVVLEVLVAAVLQIAELLALVIPHPQVQAKGIAAVRVAAQVAVVGAVPVHRVPLHQAQVNQTEEMAGMGLHLPLAEHP